MPFSMYVCNIPLSGIISSQSEFFSAFPRSVSSIRGERAPNDEGNLLVGKCSNRRSFRTHLREPIVANGSLFLPVPNVDYHAPLTDSLLHAVASSRCAALSQEAPHAVRVSGKTPLNSLPPLLHHPLRIPPDQSMIRAAPPSCCIARSARLSLRCTFLRLRIPQSASPRRRAACLHELFGFLFPMPPSPQNLASELRVGPHRCPQVSTSPTSPTRRHASDASVQRITSSRRPHALECRQRDSLPPTRRGQKNAHAEAGGAVSAHLAMLFNRRLCRRYSSNLLHRALAPQQTSAASPIVTPRMPLRAIMPASLARIVIVVRHALSFAKPRLEERDQLHGLVAAITPRRLRGPRMRSATLTRS